VKTSTIKFQIFFTCLFFNNLNSQTILSQNFESPLSGWSTNGSITAGQNSILPINGSAMVSLTGGDYLESPNFTLPTGDKNIEFWLNSTNNTPFSYTITANLLQNSSPVLNLGFWYNNFNTTQNWKKIGINIPNGYSGTNYAIEFKVENASASALFFYLDDITASTGLTNVSQIEHKYLDNNVVISQDANNLRDIIIRSTKIKDELDLSVFDISGKIVFERTNFQITKIPTIINISDIYPGLYFIKLIDKQGNFMSRKIVIN
jgi:hypothetical protein